MSSAQGRTYDSTLQAADPVSVSPEPLPRRSLLSYIRPSAIVLVCSTLIAVSLQIATGAYHAELSGYPDEAAHFVTGLMLDEYVRHHLPSNPVHFAENYYAHYPKVAFGHWPPLLYMVQAGWTLLASPSRTAAILLQAILTGLICLLLWVWIRKFAGQWTAAVMVVIFIAMPLVQMHTSMVMAEILLTLTTFAATLAFVGFLETEHKRDALLFGGFAVLSILTKGTGWALALVPPVSILLTRKWHVLKSPGLWLSVVPVLLVGVPWQLATNKLASQGWDQSTTSAGFAGKALVGFAEISWEMAGWGIALAAVAGIWFTVLQPLLRGRTVQPFWAAMFSLLFTAWFFHIVVPAGVEPRKLIIAVPAWLAFAAVACARVPPLFPAPARIAANTGMLLLTAIPFASGSFFLWRKPSFGFEQAANYLRSTAPRSTGVLVSSRFDGEGLLISELAMKEPDPRLFAIRASKLLARMNWNGTEYECLVNNPADVSKLLSTVPVSYVVLDIRSGDPMRHHELLSQMLSQNWPVVSRFGEKPGSDDVLIYRNPAGTGPVKNLDVDLGHMLGKSLHVKP